MGLEIKLVDLKTWDDLEIYCKSKVHRKFYIKNFIDISKLQDPLDLILRFFVNKECTVYKRGGIQCESGRSRSYKEFFKIYFTYFPNHNITDCLLSLYKFQNIGIILDKERNKTKEPYTIDLYKINDCNEKGRRLSFDWCPDIMAYNVQCYLRNECDKNENNILNEDILLDRGFYTRFCGFADIPELNKSIRQYLKDKNEITE